MSFVGDEWKKNTHAYDHENNTHQTNPDVVTRKDTTKSVTSSMELASSAPKENFELGGNLVDETKTSNKINGHLELDNVDLIKSDGEDESKGRNPSNSEKKSGNKQPPVKKLRTFEIFKFADRLDILCMIIGTIACIGAGAVFPLMMFVYKTVATGFIEIIITSDSAFNATQFDGKQACLPKGGNSTSAIISDIQGMIKWYLILGAASIICYWSGFALWMTAAQRQGRRMRFALFRSIMNQEMGWFDKLNPGELTSRLIADLDAVRDSLGDKRADFICLLCRILGGLIFAVIMGWKLALVFLSLTPLTVLAFSLTMRIIKNYTQKEVVAFSKASAVAQEAIGSIRTVTAFSGQIKEEQRFADSLIEAKKIGIKKGLYMGLCQTFSQVTLYMAFTATFWYGSYLLRNECNNYQAGTVIVIFVSCLQSTYGISQIVPNIQSFAEADGSAGYVFDVISRVSKINAFTDEGEKPRTIVGDIELKNVTFTYPARQDALILRNVSMKIPSSKTVALVGGSGCGKSTSIQLIQRFYDPDEGQVFLDGKDIKTLNVAWLRSHIGVVSQEPVLFNGSIEDNIRFGKLDATDDEVENAAKMANAHEFIMALPDKYQTSSGDKLSGGQKQRVAIARALMSDPKILLLDEATSALDNVSERVVQDALDKAKEGRTTIVIAHRLSTIRNADLIIALDKGKVVEYGNHNSLMNQKGRYYELVTAQQYKEEEKDEDENSSNEEDIPKQLTDEHDTYRRRSTSNVSYRRRRTSTISARSTMSEGLHVDENDEDEETKSTTCCPTPFVFKILQLNFPEMPWIILGCISSITFGTTTPLFAFFYSHIYGLFAERDMNKANIETRTNALSILAVGVIGGICQGLSSIAFARSGEALTMRMRVISFASMLRQEISWFDREENKIGALVSQLSSDASSLKGLSGVRIGIIFNAVGTIICGLIIAFLADWRLTLVALVFAPLIVFSGKLQGKRLTGSKRNDKSGDVSWAEKGGMYSTEAIDSIRTIVGLHREEYFISRYEECFNKEFRKALLPIQLQSIGTAIANSVMFFVHSATYGYGSILVGRHEIDPVSVFRIFAVVTYGTLSVGRSTAMIPDYAKGKGSAMRILKLNNRGSKIDPHNTSGIVSNDIMGNIQLKNVKFVYPSRPKLRVLRNFMVSVNANETTALCGPSGSGKSTCIGLLLRFYDPYKGTVLLDGNDIRTLNLSWLRSQIGFVQQEPVLFNLSIRDNIAYGDNTRIVPQEEIEQAARKANIHDLIITLPQGYDTLCGAKGNQLSGGQKQRIAIARALVRNPKILLLDEATSALDIQSEMVVQAALDVARHGRTCLTIAHRLATIRNSDKIVVVDRGIVKESGTNNELMQQKGIFYKLNMAQERNAE